LLPLLLMLRSRLRTWREGSHSKTGGPRFAP
jgi:hypothetical protein